MDFKIISVKYDGRKDRDREGMMRYISDLQSSGFNNIKLLEPETEKYPSKFKINICLNNLDDFVKLTSCLGTVVFDGSEIIIYDDYIE